MIVIDGSQGEGGGQILRTALALSVLTQTPIRIERIRAGRARPGLQRQHMAAVQAAARVGKASVGGAALGSTQLTFAPGGRAGGELRLDIGTAGSTTLVLQTILLPLALGSGDATVEIIGGTHNPLAPPVEFVERTFLPLLRRAGVEARVQLLRHGFYPAGGGALRLETRPTTALRPIELLERGAVQAVRGRIVSARLPAHVAEREAAALRAGLKLRRDEVVVHEASEAAGPGNAVLCAVEAEHVTTVFSSIGERGVPAEDVAGRVIEQVREYLSHGAPVDEHLADQLLLPLALARGGAFRSGPLSSHATTNMAVIEQMLGTKFAVEPDARGVVLRVTA